MAVYTRQVLVNAPPDQIVSRNTDADKEDNRRDQPKKAAEKCPAAAARALAAPFFNIFTRILA